MIELSTIHFMIMGLGYLLSVILLIVSAFLFIHFKKQKDQYKTAVWVAMGRANRGEPVENILVAIECHMPDCDVAHFRKTFYGDKKNEEMS